MKRKKKIIARFDLSIIDHIVYGLAILVVFAPLFALVGLPWTAAILVSIAFGFMKDLYWDYYVQDEDCNMLDIFATGMGGAIGIWLILIIVKFGGMA